MAAWSHPSSVMATFRVPGLRLGETAQRQQGPASQDKKFERMKFSSPFCIVSWETGTRTIDLPHCNGVGSFLILF